MEEEPNTLRRRFLRIPLRVRLTIWYTVILAVSLLAFSTYTYLTVSSSLHENLDSILAQVATSVDELVNKKLSETKSPLNPLVSIKSDSTAAVPPLAPKMVVGNMGGPTSDLSILASEEIWNGIYRSSFLNSRNFFLQIADTSGKIYWRSRNLEEFAMPTYKTLSEGNDTGRIYFFAKKKSVTLRAHAMKTSRSEISVGYLQNEVEYILSQLIDTLEVGFPVALFFAVGVGYILARYSLRQVDIITNSAKRITAQNLSKRLPLPVTNDEIARLTTTLNEMIARLEASFTQVRQFTSDVSHELRTPLAILMGELELALRNDMTDSQYQVTVASALEEVVRLSKLVSSLLEISRAETGQVKLQRSLIDISKLTSDICDDMEILAEDKRIILEKNIQPFATLIGDESRLHQMLLNVIDNAIKYTRTGGTVKVNLTTKTSQTKIEIIDTGVGISEEDLPFVFNRFFRVDKSRSSDMSGNGLGLSIVRWIIDAHQGTIRVKSELGSGTTFTISLPYDSR